ncbi:hypothetical protein BC940DRAFT_305761 [Gongronella butleri]|nr:hypothetical protein BC940DRAFT_305761 [Gongronella butleri]
MRVARRSVLPICSRLSMLCSSTSNTASIAPSTTSRAHRPRVAKVCNKSRSMPTARFLPIRRGQSASNNRICACPVLGAQPTEVPAWCSKKIISGSSFKVYKMDEVDGMDEKSRKSRKWHLISTNWSVYSRTIGNDHDEDSPTAAAIRSNHSIKPQCGLFYYEVEVLSDGMSDGHIGVGFCWNISRTDRLPGVDGYSWGYHGENGHIYSSSLSQGGQMFGRPTSSNNNNSGASGRSGVGASQRDSGSLPGRSLSSSSSSSSSSSNTSNNSNNNARPTSSGGRGGGRGVDWAASERSLLYDDSLHVYNGSSSHLYFAVGPSQHRAYGPTFGTGDIVGCGLDFRNNSIFFTRNGVALGTAFCQIRGRRFHPMVGFKHPGDGITTNFGQKPFVFNIEQYRKDEMNRTLQHILLNDSKHDDTNYTYDQPNAGHRNDHHRLFRRPRQNTQKQRKSPPIESPAQQEKAVLDDLVLNYLHHAGYTGTYLALKKQTVDLGANAANNHTTDDVKESLDYALLRHEICQDVRNGLIDQVFQKCEQHYSGMLDRHARLCFRLRCQKFITCVQQMDSRKNKQAEGRQLHQPQPQDAMVASMAIASPVSSASPSVSPMSVDASSSSATATSTKRKRDGAAFESDDDDDNARVAQRPRRAALPSATEKSTDNYKERDATRAEHEFNDVSSVMGLEAVMEYGQFLQETYGPKTALVTEKLTDIDVKDELTASFSILAYTNASDNPNLYLTEAAWRQVIANDLNDAILCEQGEPGTSSIERLYQQTSVATRELVMLGDGEASMIPKLEHIL